MGKLTDTSVLEWLDDLETPSIEACTRGIKLSRITSKLKGSVDITPLLTKFQQLGFIKIVFNPSVDDEPFVQITEKGKLQVMELLISLQPIGR